MTPREYLSHSGYWWAETEHTDHHNFISSLYCPFCLYPIYNKYQQMIRES